MVRKYVKKRKRYVWNEGEMKLASDKIKSGISFSSVAKESGIPRSTLRNKFRNDQKNECREVSGFKRTFSDDQEKALATYVDHAFKKLQGLSGKEIRKLAYDYAEKLKIPHRFNKDNGMAGEDWLYGFNKRHDFSHRRAEHTSTARANGFNRQSVEEFFDEYEKIILEKKIKPENIWNVDETKVSICPKSTSKIVAKRGTKQVGGLTAAEKGEHVTAECCMSATGQFMPPMLIFPRINRNPEYLVGAPAGAWGEFEKSGWINAELFTKWFKEFIKFSKASSDNPVLLLLDGHSSHVKNLEVIDLAMENNVEILCFPPHCTHRMQPLDTHYNKSLSSHYDNVIREAQRQGKITMKDIFKLFGLAWQKAAKIETAVNGFRDTGLVPFNRSIFPDSSFVELQRDVDDSGCSAEIRECLNVIKELRRNETSNVTQSSQELSNNQIILEEKIKQAQSLIHSNYVALNGLFKDMLNITGNDVNAQSCAIGGNSSELSSLGDDVNPINGTVNSVVTGDAVLPSLPAPKSRKGKAARITTQSYKENLAATKPKTAKKKPLKEKGTPKVLSVQVLESPPPIINAPIKRKMGFPNSSKKLKSAGKIPEYPILTVPQNFQPQLMSKNVQEPELGQIIFSNQNFNLGLAKEPFLELQNLDLRSDVVEEQFELHPNLCSKPSLQPVYLDAGPAVYNVNVEDIPICVPEDLSNFILQKI